MRLLCLFVAVLAVAAQTGPFTVGPLRAEPGASASGMLSAPGAEIPVTLIHGARPGPVLALVAGLHGYEYPPILALQKLRAEVDPKRLSGTLIVVHVANMPSFLGRTVYFSPLDQKNLNRVFPGDPAGTVSERIAHVLTREVIERCDCLVDLHCGDGNESLWPYLYQPVTGDAKLDAAIAQMAEVWGIEHMVIDRGRSLARGAPVTCSATALARGKPALIVEDGHLGTTDPASVSRLMRGATSLMRHLKMLEGAPEKVRKPVYLEPTELLTSPATGILYPAVERGRPVKKGALVATITDFFGRELAQVRAGLDGIVLYVVATPPITKGQPVAFIGAVKK